MKLIRSWPVAFALCVVVVAATIAWLDKPVAAFAGNHLWNTAPFDLAIALFRTFDPIGILALVFLVGAGAWGLTGRPLNHGMRTAMLCCIAGLMAFVVGVALKYLTGRSGADVYATTGVNEWRPLSGNRGHIAFPSATMIVAGAAYAVVWVREKKPRAIGGAVCALVCVALLVANAHWLSDIIAGTFLGWFIGRRLACASHPLSAS